NRPSKWSNATHNNNRGRRRGSSRRARIRRLSRRRKSLNSPLAAGRWPRLNSKIAFGWPILAGLFHARVGAFALHSPISYFESVFLLPLFSFLFLICGEVG